MRNAKSSVIRSPMRAVVPPSVMPCLPAVPKMAPTMPLTMPLRMSPAPRAASQPSTTLTQLVPLSASEDDLYPELRPDASLSLRASSTLRGPVPPRPSERTSLSSTLGASVLPSLLVIRLLLSSVVLSVCSRASLLGRAFGLGQKALVEQCGRYYFASTKREAG